MTMQKEKDAYRCPECGCTNSSWEMGGYWMGWHYVGCSDWDAYVSAGPQPECVETVIPTPDLTENSP